MKTLRNILVLCFLFCIVYAFSSCAAVGMIMSSNEQKEYAAFEELNTKYKYNSEVDAFIEDETEIANIKPVMNNVYESMPTHIRTLIQKDWHFVISVDEPFNCCTNVRAAGITYYEYSVIWLTTGFDERVMAHECGHAIDKHLGNISGAKEFISIYNSSWNTYREFDTDNVDKHSTSSFAEFFAATFADYILHPDYMKEQSPELYTYFNTLLTNDWRFTDGGKFWNAYFEYNKKIINLIPNAIKDISMRAEANISNKNIDVSNNELINLDNYQTQIDTSWLSDDARMITEIMLDLIQNPDKYPNEKRGFSEGYVVHFDYAWSIYNYEEVLSFASMYFGDESIDPIDVNVTNGVTTDVVIKHDVVLAGEQNRLKYLNNVEEAIKTLHSGTDTEILIQISKYIVDNTSYKVEKSSSFASFWDNKSGDCVMYAMTFKQFADRLGFDNDIVSTVSEDGVGHVYNRVLINGQYRYYDLTNKLVDAPYIDTAGYHINIWKTQ